MNTRPIRILVVEDSPTVRARLCELIAAAPGLEVAGEAGDGRRAIELCRDLRPDVVTMDMMLPVMSGLAATEFIMAYCPTPIVVVSASTNRGELFKTYEALAAGALEVLDKPRGDESDEAWAESFLATLRLASRVRVITHPRARLGALSGSAPVALARAHSDRRDRDATAVVIGASTGGPAAIVALLRGLPASFALPVLFVLHIGEPFGTAFAEWLDGQTSHRVRYARDGEPLAAAAARVTMAPPDYHLLLRDGRLRLTRDPERHSCRPSVDVLFESAAHELGEATVACLLTGMGRDGAAGMLAVRRAGGLTIAQDEGSSAVFGMPREAVLLGAAERVLPIEEIGPALGALEGASSEVRR